MSERREASQATTTKTSEWKKGRPIFIHEELCGMTLLQKNTSKRIDGMGGTHEWIKIFHHVSFFGMKIFC